MDTPLTRKLNNFVRLSAPDRYLLGEVLEPARMVEPRVDIVEEGEDPRSVNVVLSGWACRYRQFEDGRRQIISILLPGDCCDPHIHLLDRRDHAIAALTQVAMARISGQSMAEISSRSPNLTLAFHREALAGTAIQREWTVSLGRRSGAERLAHLFCELHARLAAVDLADETSCPMPLTQPDLADALGQTTVHINRTLQDLRAAQLLTLKGRRLTVLDPEGLRHLAKFDPLYLHLTAAQDAGRRLESVRL
jgi:CRP-like cAMP-binding protein